jgi:hypothetical protein
MNNTRRHPRSLFFPVLLILVGGFLMLNQLNLLPGSTWDVLIRLWPLIFVVGGLDSLLKREGFTGAIFAIGLGTILLMGSFGYLNNTAWHSLLRFWPLIIIAAGLDLIIGRRGKLSAVLGILIGLVLVAGMFWLVITPAAMRLTSSTTPFSQTLNSQGETRMVFNQAVGDLEISAGAAEANLLEGNLTLVEGEQVNWGMQNDQTFEMKSVGNGVWVITGFAQQSRWDVNLTAAIPLTLDLETAAGQQNIDLRGLQVKELDEQLAFGELHLTLPKDGSLHGSVQCAFGRMVISVPKGAAVRFSIDKAVASLSIPAGYTRNGDLVTSPAAAGASQVMEIELSQPVGSILIQEVP